MLEIDDHPALVPIHGPVAGTLPAAWAGHLARRISRGRLDLDDICAQVAEQHRAERPGHDLAAVDDLHADKRRVVGGHRLAPLRAHWLLACNFLPGEKPLKGWRLKATT